MFTACLTEFISPLHENLVTIQCVCLEVSISNVIPESLDICPQLHLKQISQSSGITLLIHKHTSPDRLDYMYIHVFMLKVLSYILEIFDAYQ